MPPILIVLLIWIAVFFLAGLLIAAFEIEKPAKLAIYVVALILCVIFTFFYFPFSFPRVR